MAAIHITDIEAAINWWRERSPSPDGLRACDEVLALAEVYGLMVYYHEADCDEATMPAGRAAGLAGLVCDRRRTRRASPSAPPSQGDAVCKGCGRSFEEVQHWQALSPAHKRAVWRRITMEATAWRFNRYAERARLASGADHPPPDSFKAAS